MLTVFIIGIVFAIFGLFFLALFLGIGIAFWGAFVLLPIFFIVIGLGLMSIKIVHDFRLRNIRKKGKKYPAKVYGYAENKSFVVNDSYPINVKVHFFDDRHVEREVVLPTSITDTSKLFPVGMTIDIFEYNGKYSYDEASLRHERIDFEEELMDDTPIAPEDKHLISIKCKQCGASYQAAQGYSSRCPYCGSYTDV
ncbi:MAG: hypothetical protein Q4B15_08575 [Lachnospiraceae bacterium]|nr:hypothetical protein [Lachnospiraceae bacterium]